MSDILLVERKIKINDLKELAERRFGDMVKAVVDVRRFVMAVGGELHADEEALLLDNGSDQADLWGVNIYLDKPGREDWLEFDSLINIRPSQGNSSRSVEDRDLQRRIIELVNKLVLI